MKHAEQVRKTVRFVQDERYEQSEAAAHTEGVSAPSSTGLAKADRPGATAQCFIFYGGRPTNRVRHLWQSKHPTFPFCGRARVATYFQ